MEPTKKIKMPVRRGAHQRNRARLNRAKAYAESVPSIGNLYNAFVNWLTGQRFIAGESDYITGEAPAGGKRLQLLSPQQIKTLLPRDRKIYQNAVNKITERDAMNSIYGSKEYKEAHDAMMRDLEYQLNEPDWQYDDFDPEMEWLEYKYGGTDTYDIMYNNIAKRRGWQPKPIDWGYWR